MPQLKEQTQHKKCPFISDCFKQLHITAGISNICIESKHTVPLHSTDYCGVFLPLDSVTFLGFAMTHQFKPPNVTVLVNPPETYSHIQLCALTSMGLRTGRTKLPLNITSSPVLH